MNDDHQTYKEIMDNQHDLRVKLTSILEDKKITLNAMSKEVGIDCRTATKFLAQGKDISMISVLMKIKEYIKEQFK